MKIDFALGRGATRDLDSSGLGEVGYIGSSYYTPSLSNPMVESSGPIQLLEQLELTEYEATALEAMLTIGRTSAPSLVDATGIPQARIYGVLDELANQGFVKVFPGRPKEFQPKSPEEILDRAVENRRQEYESYETTIGELRTPFLETFEPQYQQASEEITPTEELFHVVDVGDPSESETRVIYREAEGTINVLTKSLEYLPSIEVAVADALNKGIDINMLFLHPKHLSERNQEIQREVLDTLDATYSEVGVRFSEHPLPWRGTLADPSMDYDSGTAIILVEEKDIPLHMRQAAVTENGSFVAGLKRYFELIWEYESITDSGAWSDLEKS